MYEIYKNLHKSTSNYSVYSVRHNGKVIDYMSHLELADCKLIVQKSGRKRVLKEKRKNVHAFIRCQDLRPLNKHELTSLNSLDENNLINYDPYKKPFFYKVKCGSTIEYAEKLIILNSKIYINK